MNEFDMVLHNLAALSKCRRCACLSCDRDINGLHGHICTQGEDCVDTPVKMMQRLEASTIVIGQAHTIIRSLLRQLSNNQGLNPQNEISEPLNDTTDTSSQPNLHHIDPKPVPTTARKPMNNVPKPSTH